MSRKRLFIVWDEFGDVKIGNKTKYVRITDKDTQDHVSRALAQAFYEGEKSRSNEINALLRTD